MVFIMIDIKGYEWKYQISREWKVYALDYNKTWIKKQMKNWSKDWYEVIQLRQPWERKVIWIHRLLAEYYIPKIEWKEYVNHINWIRNDNRIENLEWCTQGENNIHRFRVLWKIHSEKQKRIFWENKWKSKKIATIDSRWTEIIYDSLRSAMRNTWINNHSWIIKAERENKVFKWFKWVYQP